jgi:hypothetical protein
MDPFTLLGPFSLSIEKGKAVSFVLSIIGSFAGRSGWEIRDLPSGLNWSVNPSAVAQCTISGTPTELGIFNARQIFFTNADRLPGLPIFSSNGPLIITVTKRQQRIDDFLPVSPKRPGQPPFSIALPVASSGLPVTVTVKSGPATISGEMITLTGTEGSVVLAANQAGDEDYAASTEVLMTFMVSDTNSAPVAEMPDAYVTNGVYFGWAVARQAGMEGHPVRRSAWTDRWLYFYNGLWWVMPSSGTPRVVRTLDFTTDDFLATDWTNLSATCITSSAIPGGGAAPCPLPYDPISPAIGPLAISGASTLPK